MKSLDWISYENFKPKSSNGSLPEGLLLFLEIGVAAGLVLPKGLMGDTLDEELLPLVGLYDELLPLVGLCLCLFVGNGLVIG